MEPGGLQGFRGVSQSEQKPTVPRQNLSSLIWVLLYGGTSLSWVRTFGGSGLSGMGCT